MKKRTKLIAASLSALVVISGVGIGASVPVGGVTKVNYQFIVNEKKLELPSHLTVMSKDNATYVPLRFLSENMGLKVDYMPGTVRISSDKFEVTSTDQTKNKIADLENQVKELKSENDILKKKVASTESNLFYKKLPASASSGDGMEVRVTNVSSVDDGISLYVELLNSSVSKSFVVNPSKTILTVDGENYEGSIGDDISLINTLVSAPSENQPSRLAGRIIIKGVKNTNIKGALLVNYSDNEKTDQTMQLLFDNTK